VIMVSTSKQPNGTTGGSRRHHLSSSDWAERLWSKDQAASRLHHRRSVGRPSARRAMRLKPVGLHSRFRRVVAGARMPVDAAGGSFRN
jgi:hypothetical protein